MPLCFSIENSIIKNRYDPHHYQPKFTIIEEKMNNSIFEIKTLKEISEQIKTGKTPKSGGESYTTDNKKGIPFIRSGDINYNDELDFDKILYIKKSVHDTFLKGSKLKKGDILIAIVGTTIGKVSLYNYIEEANINQAIASVRINEKIAIPQYIKTFISSNIGQEELDMIKRPVARANINLEEIGNFKIILPPLKIQERIVKTINKSNKEINQLKEKTINIKKTINKELLELLKIKIKESPEMISFSEPQSHLKNKRWDATYYQPKYQKISEALSKSSVKFEKFGKFIEYINYGASVKNEYTSEGIPFLRILNIKPNKIDTSNIVYLPSEIGEKLTKSIVNEDDILISRSGTIGIVAKVPKNANGYLFGSFLIRFRVKSEFDPDFISIWLNTDICQKILKKEKIGAVQSNITIPTIKNIEIPLLPLKEQKKIVENYNNKIKIIENNHQKSKSIKKTCLNQLEKKLLQTKK